MNLLQINNAVETWDLILCYEKMQASNNGYFRELAEEAIPRLKKQFISLTTGLPIPEVKNIKASAKLGLERREEGYYKQTNGKRKEHKAVTNKLRCGYVERLCLDFIEQGGTVDKQAVIKYIKDICYDPFKGTSSIYTSLERLEYKGYILRFINVVTITEAGKSFAKELRCTETIAV